MTDTQKALDALLPCPFCGGEAGVERYGTPRASTIISCLNCGCRLESGETRRHGWAWNTRAALEAKAVDAENAHDMIRYLLPLAKGYVAANPGIRSTETIIEDAEAMIAEAGRGKL